MIKIINGVFGFNDGTSVIPKTSKDEPFEAGEKIEKELVAKGVAEYVGKTEAVVEVEEQTEPTAPTGEPTEEAEEINLEALSFAELKEYAKEHGATDEDLKPLKSKAQVIDLIGKIFSEEAEEVLDLNSDDGVVE